MPAERWVITGASGQLGSHVVRQLAHDGANPTVLALVGQHRVGTSGVTTQPVDLADSVKLRICVSAMRATHVLHLGARTAVRDCYEDPDEAHRVNVEATRVLADAAVATGARFVFTSTDMVFDGRSAPYRELDTPNPLSVYGRTKAAAETYVAECPNALIARVPLMYGYSLAPRETTFEKMIHGLRHGEPLRLFTDEFRTPAWLGDVARALIGLARREVTGVVHVTGPERLSRYELIARCADILGVQNGHLQAIRQADVESEEPRPADLSLCGEALRKIAPELAPGPVRDEVFAGRSR